MERAIDIAKRAVVIAVASVALVYVCDGLWVWYRMGNRRAGDPLGAVTFYYATTLKNNRVEVFYDQPQTEVCVRSLFPHLGHRPCWYASRDTVKRIG
jgi:hypothetical protein